MNPLLASGIMALVNYGIGGVVAYFDDKNEAERMEDEIKEIKRQNGIQEKNELDTRKLTLDQNLLDLELEQSQLLGSLNADGTRNEADGSLYRGYQYNLNKENLEFNAEKESADFQANLSDAQSTFNEQQLGNNLNNQMNMLRVNQFMNGLAYNSALIQDSQSRGNSLAAMASSGARSGSISQAVDMQSAVNSQALQMQQDVQRQGDVVGINSMLNDLNASMYGISQNRNQADFMRNRYSEGGSAYQQHQFILNSLDENYAFDKNNAFNTYSRKTDELNALYNQDVTNIKDRYQSARDNLDWQKKQWDDNKWNRILTKTFGTGTNINNAGMNILSASKYF